MAAWLCLAVVAGVVTALARDLTSPALSILAGVILLMVAGVVTPAQAFAGFSNPAPITVAALFVLAAGVQKTGALHPLIDAMMGRSGSGRRSLVRLLFPTAAISGFVNNTPVVAMLAPQVAAWARRRGESPSRFLMPLSFATILGGTVTLVGTSTNLLVSGMLQASGRKPLGMFELSAVGLPVAVAGLAFLVLIGVRLLPDRRGATQQALEEIRAFTVGMTVVPGGLLDGVSVEGGGLRHLQGVFLVQLSRAREIIAPVGPGTVLQGGDQLIFAGKADLVIDLQHMRGLVSTEQEHLLSFDQPGHTFFEAVIGGASSLVGRTLREARFRGSYHAAVLAIHRSGQRVEAKLGDVRLKVGDTLLIVSDPGFADRWRDRPDFLLVSHLGGSPPMANGRAAIVGLIMVAVVGLAALGVLSILETSLLGVIALVALGILSPREVRNAVDLDTIIVIAASFGLGAAIDRSGLAGTIAHLVVAIGGHWGMAGAVLAVVLATVALTELITNNAAAALMFPVAMAAAADVGADARAFAIALAVAASASFLTPIGYQTNTMVYGMGGYRFSDFARVGAGLTLLAVVGITVLVGVLGVH